MKTFAVAFLLNASCFFVCVLGDCRQLQENVPKYMKDAYIPAIQSLDTVIQIRVLTIVSNAFFDALSAYHPTLTSIVTEMERRPASEWTNMNKNIAMAYAGYQVLISVLPGNKNKWRQLLLDIDLDPDNNSTDTTTPIGIGNVAGRNVRELREHDGMNQLGDMNEFEFNKMPYLDYTGYEPSNTPLHVLDVNKYQPLIFLNSKKEHISQFHLYPQLQNVLPYSFNDFEQYPIPPPLSSDMRLNLNGYMQQTLEVLSLSAGLNDYRKMSAEFFENKIPALLYQSRMYALNKFNRISLDDYVIFEFGANMALFDAAILTWYGKLKYDSVRPQTAVKVLFYNQTFAAWGGPGREIVSDMTGRDWKSYLNTAPHSEYPSASTCFCAAQSEFMRKFFGSDDFGFSFPRPRGSSVIEPGLTPTSDITLGPFHSFTDYVNQCGEARILAGVHFRSSVETAKSVCTRLGSNVYKYFQSLL